MSILRLARATCAPLAGLAALSLAGCISLLPKEKPARLYRFAIETGAPPAAAAPTGARFAVRAAPMTFERAAGGDRILTVDGDRTAYIAGARWVTPAPTLFEAAVTRAFEVHADRARLLAQGEPSLADYVLKLDVRTFEVRYGAGPEPTVTVEVYAALVGRKDPEDVVSRTFRADSAAASNSVHAITSAFDTAVGATLTQMVAWVDAKGRG